ncbi:esterase family protein [Cohnella sp. REN36]|uniref:alpha/beta hydrolase n=1 Tax=Cohnella sp. REN36 TaxID=2887347 RepID=UPI001D13A768|nr:alpha/beta hydrolase-fold protein [Cohnella sp. REN36]MCC3372009.1 esterase [Cohnella sp. REN36]
MANLDAAPLPDKDLRAVRKELQGTVREIHYPVNHYIHSSRQLAIPRHFDAKEAGRETVEGNPIEKTCRIYLPAGYDEKDTDTRYNVMYLLHGVGGDQDEWLGGNGIADGNYILCNLIDNLIANGEIEPLIVVFPNGRSAHDWRDRAFTPAGTNMLGFYYFDYELRYDLIPFIESNYATISDIMDGSPEGIDRNRLHRAIAGLSMGGMQALNLVLGGHRYDSVLYTGTQSSWKNGLDETVLAPGMADLFAYVGAFSNAPTSSGGNRLGTRLAESGRKLQLLHMTCGDADEVALESYRRSVDGLAEAAGEALGEFYQALIKDGHHDFRVWNNSLYHFIRLAYRKAEERGKPSM